MTLLTLRDINLSYGHPPLLDGLHLCVQARERIGLLGRNGEGKSTLLRLIAGELAPDSGERVLSQGTKIARLAQEVPTGMSGSVFAVVASGLGESAACVAAYHAASQALISETSDAALQRLAQAQQALEAVDGWQLNQQVEAILSRMQLSAEAEFADLSGGMQRRVLLARALVGAPDILLLDEPTNHLDITAIEWLEHWLLDWPGSLVFITHDRSFLQRLATRIVELNRGQIRNFPGDYAQYQRRRAELDHAEAQQQAQFDRKLAQEEVWIRQGIQARRTRNEGRVRQLQAMRTEYQARRQQQGQAKLQLNLAESSGKRVCEATRIHFARGDHEIIRDFSTTILRGDRIGIIGPNGCGKSTLLQLLLGKLQPTSGQVTLGTQLRIAYSDQMRAQLDEQQTVLDTVAGGSEQVTVNGKQQHVISYLADFLFAPARSRQSVKVLSGGERNRLLLAKLFTQPANLLVLDEPTNDLDLETLELLEERLLHFTGTLLLVSHDRAFIDRVVTSTLVFEGKGNIQAYVGGYTDWLRQRPTPVVHTPDKSTQKSSAQPKQKAKPKKAAPVQRELAALPGKIDTLEAQLSSVQEQLAASYQAVNGQAQQQALQAQQQQLEAALQAAYDRWETLEAG